MAKRFKVGDKVRVIKPVSGNEYVVGKVGTIIQTEGIGMDYAVSFDEYFLDHHTCNGKCTYGYYVDDDQLGEVKVVVSMRVNDVEIRKLDDGTFWLNLDGNVIELDRAKFKKFVECGNVMVSYA